MYANFLSCEKILIKSKNNQKINEIKTQLYLQISENFFSSKSKYRKNNPISEILISGIADPDIRENGRIKIKKVEKLVIYLIIYLLAL